MRPRFHLLTLLLALPLFLAADRPETPKPDRPAGVIAFSSLAPRGWDVYLTDLQTRQSRPLTTHPALDYNAAFSPDGSQIAFVSERDGNMELYVMGTDGKGLRRLTNEFALDDHPCWSPDGKRLAFVSTRQPAKKPGQAWNAVYLRNADGSEVRRISPADAADYSACWSPKGDLIACASGSGTPGGTDLYVMKPDGSGRRLVVKNGGWPSFAADGASLFFHRRDGHWGIWRMHWMGQDWYGSPLLTWTSALREPARTANGWSSRSSAASIGRSNCSTCRQNSSPPSPATPPITGTRRSRRTAGPSSTTAPRPAPCPTSRSGALRRGPTCVCSAWPGRSLPSPRTASA